MSNRLIYLISTALIAWAISSAAASERWSAGLSRVDVTPREAVRMAGYGSRDHPSQGIDTPLYVRCMALKSDSADAAALLVSVDTIGLPGSMTRGLAERISRRHGIDRDRVVFCSTHTHAGPDLISELSNIFAVELSEEEIAAGTRYRKQLEAGILKSVELALDDMAPAQLAYDVGQAEFAANRRVLTNGRWSGFGVQPDGPVDHTVPVLRIVRPGGKIRGVVFNYACHCTTLGGDHYQINGDWAGYAAANLEAKYSGAVALCTIGCGADANPEPRGTLDATKIHGRTLAAEVSRLVDGEMTTIDAPLETRFDYAALSFDLPTEEELQQRTRDSSPQTRRHAEQMLGVLKEHGRLPATYPVPIQAWQFGSQLTMVFLGGEVVVDYALRLKQSTGNPRLWVTAYANDVLGYIVSERMRGEGGYEYDRSGIYYGLPGPWATGSEDLMVARIERMLNSRGRSRPLPADEAIETFQLIDGLEIELAAAEPLVQDPINIAFDASGRLWVVEMGGYPDDENLGRIKTLTDTDGDGRYDTASEFLSGLSYPTGVLPWGDGVLVSAAPEILIARDTDADGRANDVQTLYTGFRLANPQHRINGFSYGLDHSLHLASGDNLGEITSVITGDRVDASGHDVQIWPDSGKLAVTSGRTQYVRSRNDWGEWFGSDNSRPMYHFPIDDAYLKRNPAAGYRGNSQQLFDPPVAPPVFPITSVTERFNDLFAAGRFTSACSAIVARTPQFRVDDQQVALICEPVHNLVHRAVLRQVGASYQAVRSQQEQDRELIASSDPWFRPVRAVIGPDGSLYVVDMYRETIEHPEWIPEAWQAQLDLRAGSDRGRIYRIRPRGIETPAMPRLDRLPIDQLVAQLDSPVGPHRDLVQQAIIERDDDAATSPLSALADDPSKPLARVHALSILDVQGRLQPQRLAQALQDSHPGVLLVAIRLAESRLKSHPELIPCLQATARHDDRRVVLATALALGQTDDARAGEILASIALDNHGDTWISQAVCSSAGPHAATLLAALLQKSRTDPGDVSAQLLTGVFVTARSQGIDIADHLGNAFADADTDFLARLRLATSLTAALRGEESKVARLLEPLYQQAIRLAHDPQQDEQLRCQSLRLVGIGIDAADREQALLLELISPTTPAGVQQQAVDRLVSLADEQALGEIFDRWPSMSQSVRDHCVSRLLERRAWTERLLGAMESGEIKASDLTPAARQQLTHTGTRSMRVRAQRVTRAGGSRQKRQLVDSYLSSLRGDTVADIAEGAALFKQHCAVCHVASHDGLAVGASLDNLTDRSNQALLTAILDPNRAVDPKYQSYVVLTEDDRILVGAIESESGPSITLAHADGKRSTISRSEIVELKNSGVSLMPEGLESVLPPAAMRHLIRYLQSQPTTEDRQP